MAGDTNTILLANPGADLYGSDRMALETVRALVNAGRRVVVTVPHAGPLVEFLTDAGAEVVECPTPIIRKSLMSVRGLMQLAGATIQAIGPSRRLLKTTNAGIVIVNTVTPPLWLLMSRLAHRRTICHVHEGESSAPRWLQRALYLPLRCAHRIVTNSDFSLRTMAAVSPGLRRRARVVYNAVAGPERVIMPRERIEDPLRLVFIGRLSHRKGPHVAVEALALLRNAGYDARLRIVGAVFPGNEAYEDDLTRKVASCGLTGAVDLVGFAPSVWSEVSRGDIMLVPSTIDEPFGNTAVEAALAARPAVVSDVGGLPEAARFSSSAVLVPPADASALAEGVRHIANEWARATQRAVKDAKVVAERFSATRYAQEILRAVDSGPERSSSELHRAGEHQPTSAESAGRAAEEIVLARGARQA